MNLRRSELLDAQTSEPLAHVDAGLKRLALEDTSQETTSEGVTSTVGIVDLLRFNGVDGELLDVVLTLDSNQCRVGALGDDGDSLSLLVLLREVGKMLGNILGLLAGKIVGLSVSGGLGLVANDVVPIRGASIDRILEELGDERSRERENKRLVVLSSLLGELHNGRRAD